MEEQLWRAAEYGNIAMISHCVLQGADINSANPNDDGWTALIYASHEGLSDIVEALIRKFGADVNKQSISGKTALHVACTRLNRSVIERLLLAGINANIQQSQDGCTPLHILAKFSSDEELIKLLLPFTQHSLVIKNKQGLFPHQLSNFPSI